ncbi:MAG: hypothetical protein WBA61_06275 [Aequorivita sp.]
MKIEILRSKIIDGVISASGLVKAGDKLYVVSDDAPFLYTLDGNYNVISQLPISTIDAPFSSRIEKSIKPDFEALDIVGDNEIIAFGSGSKSPERDIFLRIFINGEEEIKTYQISEFYAHLKNLEVMENRELNIEAVAYKDGRIFLFNRGQNVVFGFVYVELISYFEGNIPFPTPRTKLFQLPDIRGIRAGFSGATALKGHPYIIFTASVEDTPNAYDDGEVLGSFIGILRIEGDFLSNEFKTTLFPTMEKLKVESVIVSREVKLGETHIVVITDDDYKDSLIIDCKILW